MYGVVAGMVTYVNKRKRIKKALTSTCDTNINDKQTHTRVSENNWQEAYIGIARYSQGNRRMCVQQTVVDQGIASKRYRSILTGQ